MAAPATLSPRPQARVFWSVLLGVFGGMLLYSTLGIFLTIMFWSAVARVRQGPESPAASGERLGAWEKIILGR